MTRVAVWPLRCLHACGVVTFGFACAVGAGCSSQGNDVASADGGAGGSSGTGTAAGTGPTGTGGTATGSGGSAAVSSGGSPDVGSAGTVAIAGTSALPTGGGGATGSGGSDTGSGGTGGGVSSGGGPAGGTTGAAAGCPTGAAFCDDFEASATALGSAWTMDNTLGATIKVVNTFTTMPGPTMAHSGNNAVQISFTTGMGYAMLVEKMGVPPAPAAMGYWGRVWMYIETPASDVGHDVYIEGSTGMNLGNNGARPLNTQAGKMTINIDPVGTGEAGANSPTAIPRGAWTCFEWQISATGGNGNVVLYAGGSMMPTVSLNGKPIQALTEQRVGYERYKAGTAGDLWIDDYAIGSARLGCM